MTMGVLLNIVNALIFVCAGLFLLGVALAISVGIIFMMYKFGVIAWEEIKERKDGADNDR